LKSQHRKQTARIIKPKKPPAFVPLSNEKQKENEENEKEEFRREEIRQKQKHGQESRGRTSNPKTKPPIPTSSAETMAARPEQDGSSQEQEMIRRLTVSREDEAHRPPRNRHDPTKDSAFPPLPQTRRQGQPNKQQHL
jgi:hypothetical protein